MSKARGFVYEDGIGLRMTRQNTRYASGGEWKTPFKINYLDIEYDLDKNGNQLFNTDGTKKIKEQKWEPFLHAVPVPGETASGGTGNHFVRYAGLSDLSTTVNVYPATAIADAGFDTDAVLMMNGDVKFTFYRKANASPNTIRNYNFEYEMRRIVNVEGVDMYYVAGSGWDNGQEAHFDITVPCRDLGYAILVWVSSSAPNLNTGWNPDLDTSYTLTF